VLEQLQDLLPESTEIFTPYGATEALPVSNIGSRAILGTTRQRTEQGDGVCVGKLVPGVSVKVIRISNEAYPTWAEATEVQAGEIGEFVVGGAITTQEYYRREEATRMAKIVDPQSGLRWHRMGDVGWIDDDGQLWFCGRKSHRVVLPSGTLFTDQVEPIFNRVPGVQRTALVAAHDATTDSPVAVVCVEAKHFTPTVLELLTRQKQSDPRLSAINCFLHYPGVFPVDVRHNSKIFREKLAVWATKYLSRKEGVRT
jgi:acyl-CoA synthetase (AMP-forming)/AMP-acid ligase II